VKDVDKTKSQLISELEDLRQHITELELVKNRQIKPNEFLHDPGVGILSARFFSISLKLRAMIIIGVFALYGLIYLPLRTQIGNSAGLLAIAPVGLAGVFFGLRGGLIAGVAITPLHTLLVNMTGLQGWNVILRETNGLGTLVTVVVGIASGYWSDLVRVMQRHIANRKLAEEEMRKSDEKYRGLFNGMDEGVAINELVFDEFGDVVDYIVLDVNPAFEKQSPYKTGDAIGKRATDLYQMSFEFIRNWFGEHPNMQDVVHTEMYHEPSKRWFFIATTPPDENRFATIFTDITERKQTEQLTNEYLKRLERSEQDAGLGSWEFDVDTEKSWWSRQMFRMLGFDDSTEPPDFEEFLSHIHPEDSDYLRQVLNNMVEGKNLSQREFRTNPKHAAYRILHPTFNIERDRKERAIKYTGTLLDITERKQTEEMVLLQSVALEAVANAIVITDPEGIIQWANPAFTKLTGHTLVEALGKNPRDLIRSGLHDQAFYKNMWDTILAGKVWHDELINRRKDGTLYTEEMTLTPLKDENGEIIRFIAIKQDVSERVRAEQIVRDSQARLASIIDSAMDAIISLDANERIILFNPAAEQMFRCPADEVLGQPLDRFLPEHFRESHHDHIHKFGQEGQTNRSMGSLSPLTCLRADGEEFPAEIAISQTEMAGEKIYTAILRDITERVKVAEMLNQRIGELSALYQTTLDIIRPLNRHELLNTIVARAVDLLEGTGGGLYLCDPEQRQVRCVVSYNTPDDYTDIVLDYGEGAAGTVAATGEPLVIEDYRTWEGRARAFDKKRPFSAVISVPMLWHEQVIGVVHVLHETEVHNFTRDDLKLLTSFANQAAIAVENTRLHEETQLRLEQLATLRQIDQVITSGLDLRVTLEILLGHVLKQLEVDAAVILLYQPDLQSLDFIAGQGFRTQALKYISLRLGQGFAGQVALEKRVLHISDLEEMQTGFLRSPEFRRERFVSYIGIPLIAKGKISGVLEIYHRQPIELGVEWMAFLDTLAGQVAIAIDNILLFENLQSSNLQLRQAYDATIEGWAKALELRDMETKGHSHRTVEFTLELARRLGVEEKNLTHIRWGALLHDIGKMGVPDSILQKPGPLTDEEWRVMRLHPVNAYTWLSPIGFLRPALDITYCHHEKWDGSGYPQGLKGERIPLAARVFAVVDVWDALSHDRPYRNAWSQKEILKYLREQSGKHFDPGVVEPFIQLLTEKKSR